MTGLNDKDVFELSDDELAELLSDFAPKEKPQRERTPEEERIIAGFAEIRDFFRLRDRIPAREAEDIVERMLAIRLQTVQTHPVCSELLKDFDPDGLLTMSVPSKTDVSSMNPDELAELLGNDLDGDLFALEHVRPADERFQPESVAERRPCKDFARYREMFDTVTKELKEGTRHYVSLQGEKNKEIHAGEFYVLHGQTAYIAEVGKFFENTVAKLWDARMRVIFSNGTESNYLMRSFQRAMYKDPNARGITESDLAAIFESAASDVEGLKTNGTIYVLRSRSDDPVIREHRNLIHKIGVTKTPVKTRIANAALDPTYLMADVEVVATYDLYGIEPVKLENLIHRVFSSVQLDIEITDRFGKKVKPREWFMVPLPVVDELIAAIQSGRAEGLRYDPLQAKLVSDDTSV